MSRGHLALRLQPSISMNGTRSESPITYEFGVESESVTGVTPPGRVVMSEYAVAPNPLAPGVTNGPSAVTTLLIDVSGVAAVGNIRS